MIHPSAVRTYTRSRSICRSKSHLMPFPLEVELSVFFPIAVGPFHFFQGQGCVQVFFDSVQVIP